MSDCSDWVHVFFVGGVGGVVSAGVFALYSLDLGVSLLPSVFLSGWMAGLIGYWIARHKEGDTA